jgi:hypothetical protein
MTHGVGPDVRIASGLSAIFFRKIRTLFPAIYFQKAKSDLTTMG